ncbi:hypothetical protein SLEP1_g621 [Rubroshorea leprosula]|uniref:Uncharacterized protein n=1 Tax=Rubroshorea leprosula TaxID=152421 RepID=A0AAV5HJV9_9ROSI|nr:hypothetical protein SLEP1_g621 [Rubroshorea leprosula]
MVVVNGKKTAADFLSKLFILQNKAKGASALPPTIPKEGHDGDGDDDDDDDDGGDVAPAA